MGLTDFMSSRALFGGAFDPSQDQIRDLIGQSGDAWQWAKPGNTQYGEYKPDDYQYAGDVNPMLANYQTVQEDPNLLSNQQAYLAKMSGLADNGLSDIDKASFDNARSESEQQARGASDAIKANAMARGALSGGAALGLQEQAAQGGAERSRKAMLDQAAASAKQRALYTQAYGDSLGQVRNQNQNIGKTNSDIINNFNQYNTSAQNNALLRNVTARQQLGNMNTQTHNQAQQGNIDNAYTADQNNINNRMKWAGGFSGSNNAAEGQLSGIAKQHQDAQKQDEANMEKMMMMF